MIRDRNTAEHYVWGANCDGWMLAGGPDLSVIHERMPPGTAEARHVHARARQVFFVLEGELTMVTAGGCLRIGPQQSAEIAPGEPHQARNEGPSEVFFLVISSPATRGDRTDLSES
ncbi:cupin domain-containing protein [Mangrovicoccus sp. HB161399]|uniref:cupin domain-containing protein n=1 Tax=Mangrovicoccus sp. HB161399 TaxID=2720392 RepID=UPI0015581BDE|nr:cupin domain-containing protein [Mangrovicoccus sp. HB161399]